MATWDFYGRRSELAEIERLLAKKEFFFCSISGRRRIGKTSLIHEALRRKNDLGRALYVQIPDSDERGVIQVFEDSFEDTFKNQKFARDVSKNFSDIATTLRLLWGFKFITAIDEFQYFHRKALSEFLSHLQNEVDRARRGKTGGGLFALGSIHSEMTAVLEDKSSPLFNRVTDRIKVGHWDFETLFEMFRAHKISNPHHRLFLWSIFEGVPKFYRDCFDQGVLVPSDSFRSDTLKVMFFQGSSPLKDEAEHWFLRELRGRYDSVLKLVARMSPCSYGELKAEYDRTGSGGDKQLGGYLRNLIEKYQMVEKLTPVFSGDQQRKTRYRISDNFLNAWLTSIARNVQLARVRPIDKAVENADKTLMEHEGLMLEKMVRQLLEECSRKATGDFPLTSLVRGYWNKADGSDIEIDIVAVNDDKKSVRFGSCKRSEKRFDSTELASFENHLKRFETTKEGKKFTGWKKEKALYCPEFSASVRKNLQQSGYLCIDLVDFERWLSAVGDKGDQMSLGV